MMSALPKALDKVIMDYNDNFIAKKEMNKSLFRDLLKVPDSHEANRLHEEASRPLLDNIRILKDEIKSVEGHSDGDNPYSFDETLIPFEGMKPPSVMEGYLAEEIRKYFVHMLKIESQNSLFNSWDNQYFDFRLEHMLADETLSDSMEVQHMRHWAIIGKALAFEKIDSLIQKRGRKKKAKADEGVSLIDERRADFAIMVYSNLYEMELGGQLDDVSSVTDEKIVLAYKNLLSHFRMTGEGVLDDLEAFIQLKNIDVKGACNSISSGRKAYGERFM